MADHRFPCENCGAQLTFAPGQTSLVCPYCQHEQPVPEDDAGEVAEALEENDFAAALVEAEAGATYEEHRVLACPNCGAQTEFAETTQAARCPFCDTPLVAGATSHRQIAPAALVPFALSEDQARTAMNAWLGSLWFAPNGLRNYARGNRAMDGTYVPYWTFDAQTETDYSGRRGDHYYVSQTVIRNGKRETVQVQKTRWRSVRGHVARFFDDVLVLGSRSVPEAHTVELAPWDLGALRPWRADYLAGFKAEAYAVELREGWDQAQVIMSAQIDRDIRSDIGGDVQQITGKNTHVSGVTFKHILLPIWLAAYRYGDRSFRFVVNGQTGEVQGERPYSKWKIAFAILVALVLAAAAYYGYLWGVENGYIRPSGDGGGTYRAPSPDWNSPEWDPLGG